MTRPDRLQLQRIDSCPAQLVFLLLKSGTVALTPQHFKQLHAQIGAFRLLSKASRNSPTASFRRP